MSTRVTTSGLYLEHTDQNQFRKVLYAKWSYRESNPGPAQVPRVVTDEWTKVVENDGNLS